VEDVRERYDLPTSWILRRLEEWERAGVLVRGEFGADRGVVRWCSRRLLEQARRRELAQARKQIEAVPIHRFARFMQRWQHLTTDARLSGAEGTATILQQLFGVALPAAAWERDYLPARLAPFEPATLGRLAAGGGIVWAAERVPAKPGDGGVTTLGAVAAQGVGRLRFFERGTGQLWLSPPPDDASLSDAALAVRDALRTHGASFTADLAAATSLGPQRLRDALRELVAAGVVTNDTVEALRDVLRWRPVFPAKRASDPDPARWLPADYTPSPNRRVVQRRVNPRSLARWKPPGRAESQSWGGRWSLVHTPGTLGAPADAQELAEQVARQWLARYGVVSRDWWRREKPAVGWREIYHELKRLEFRGEVRRGYFVAGLAGAQFALPEAVEMLREPGAPPDAPTAAPAPLEDPVVLTPSDPANVYALPLAPGLEIDPLARPRGAGAMLVTVAGSIILTSEGRGRRLRVREGADPGAVQSAARALIDRLSAWSDAERRRRDIVIESINGEPASASPHAGALRDAGFRNQGLETLVFVTSFEKPQ
jgi:ATP-dependent Lhr-like helicase